MPITGKLPGTYTAQLISSNEVLHSIKKKKRCHGKCKQLKHCLCHCSPFSFGHYQWNGILNGMTALSTLNLWIYVCFACIFNISLVSAINIKCFHKFHLNLTVQSICKNTVTHHKLHHFKPIN